MQLIFWMSFTALVLSNVEQVFLDDSCQVGEKPKLQIVLVIPYSLNRKNNWIKILTETARYLMDYITEEFRDTEFGLTGFVDYPDNAKPSQRAIKSE